MASPTSSLFVLILTMLQALSSVRNNGIKTRRTCFAQECERGKRKRESWRCADRDAIRQNWSQSMFVRACEFLRDCFSQLKRNYRQSFFIFCVISAVSRNYHVLSHVITYMYVCVYKKLSTLFCNILRTLM